MRVLIPSPLFSYTRDQREVFAAGDSLGVLLDALDAQFPGMRHRIIDEQGRIRKHIRFFVNGELTEHLDRPLDGTDEVMIVAALSGG